MSLIHEIDFGTPRSKSEKTVTLTIDGVAVTVPEGTSIMRAAVELGREIPKLCATDMVEAFGSCRLCLVEIQGRARNACLLHHAGRRRHGGAYPDRAAEAATQGRDGALHLGAPARLPHLLGQWRLRAAGHGGRGRLARGALRLRRQEATPIRASTLPIPISPTSPRNASSARAACGPARRCKALSR